MNRVLVGAVMAAGLGLAGVAGAGVASAVPGPSSSVDCQSGCVNRATTAVTPAADEGDAPAPALQPWNALFAADPWGKFFDSTNGTLDDDKGAWESGVEAVNGGSWEKAFGEAP